MTDTAHLNVLVVDDQEENLAAYDDLFADLDARLLKAGSGRQALELLSQHEVAIALVDVQMPEMNGFQLAESMRESDRTASVPIIFTSAGLEDQGRIFTGYDLGAVDFLFKPINAQTLLAKVRVFLELQRQRRELQETLRLNERLIAVVSHDLRNPLNLVAVAVPVLTASSDPIVVATAQKIERSTRRMAAILSDLIDLSQARLGGGITVQPNPCELNNLAATVVDELLLVQHAAQIVVEPKADLRGLWDGQRIQQVLSNLLTNALRHGEPGTTITLVLDGTELERVVLSVHNLGAVASEARDGLFEPFSRTSSSPPYPAYRVDDPLTNQHGGLGLGLYIANQIVRAHAGTLEMESSDSGGTTFRVSLPRQF